MSNQTGQIDKSRILTSRKPPEIGVGGGIVVGPKSPKICTHPFMCRRYRDEKKNPTRAAIDNECPLPPFNDCCGLSRCMQPRVLRPSAFASSLRKGVRTEADINM